jgi:hypothetical protein
MAGKHGSGRALVDAEFGKVTVEPFLVDLIECEAEKHEPLNVADRFVPGICLGVSGDIYEATELLVTLVSGAVALGDPDTVGPAGFDRRRHSIRH